VRASLVPPAALDEQIETPSGRYQGLKPLGEISLDSSPPEGLLPEDRSDEFFPGESTQLDDTRELRGWTLTEFHWQAPDICHPPLYFEHVSLEVHGQSVNGLRQQHEHRQFSTLVRQFQVSSRPLAVAGRSGCVLLQYEPFGHPDNSERD
jgi:hypothetical protein